MKNYHELKEAAVMCFKLLPQYQPCKTEINHNKPQSPQDGNIVSSKYKPEASALGPSSLFQIWRY